MDTEPSQRRAFIADVRRLAKGHDVLFHGTLSWRQILAEGRLRYPIFGSEAVSFTRSAEVAVYWATLPRDPGELLGAVLVFDRLKLKERYRVEPFHDPIWDSACYFHDEAEERVLQQDIVSLSSVLLGVVWQDGTSNMIDRRPTSRHQF